MTLEQIADKAREGRERRIAVVGAADTGVLQAVCQAEKEGIAVPVLIGKEEEIREKAKEMNIGIDEYEIIDETDLAQAAKRGVRLAAEGQVDAIMKGNLHSAILMKAILNKEWGVRSGGLLSHVGIIQCPKISRLLFLTDGAMCMYPDLKQKAEIVKNAVALARRLGVNQPKVAALAAVETVNPDMPATLDAAALALMGQRGQIEGCMIDGPLALDNAVSMEAAEKKGVKSPVGVAGQADILLVPNIEAGNVILKASRHLGDCQTVGLLMGAKVPIIMSSRADTAQNKKLAIACAVYQGEEVEL